MLRLACSVALRMASGTSRALPAPWPTRPLPSPTTTSAAKPNRRPPFTTLATRLIETSFSTKSPSSRSRSRSRPPRSPFSPRAICPGIPFLELQTALAGPVGERLHPPVIEISAAVEHHRLDAGRLGALGDQEPNLLGGVLVGAGLELGLQILVERGGGRERRAFRIVDDLGVYVPARPEHGQARARRLATQIGADPPLAAVEQLQSVCHGDRLLLLAFLTQDALVVVLDALALVGLRLAEGADFRRHLADALPIGAADRDLGRLVALDRDARRDRIDHVVAEAEQIGR